MDGRRWIRLTLALTGLILMFGIGICFDAVTKGPKPCHGRACPPPLRIEDEFIGPFSGWTNVKTVYGAVGNGIADDTVALQNAFDDVGTSGHGPVLYFPAGTYRITGTLTMETRIAISLIGEHPATTALRWAGASNGVMLDLNGVALSRINRLTFDGAGTALVAVDQSYDGSGGHFDTGNEYADDTFRDVGYGIRGGNRGVGFAETAVIRSTFLRNTEVGILTMNFNALVLWVWDSVFQDCKVGVSNYPGAGNWRVYNSLFKGSTEADLEIGNTPGGFSARYNTSISSNAFLGTTTSANPAEINLQGNVILDPVLTDAIQVKNQGPLVMLDNTIRSRAAASLGPAVTHGSSTDSDTISIGNTFTVTNPIQAASRLITINDATVPRANLLSLAEPAMPQTPVTQNRQVFEVAAGASGSAIQTALNNAAAVNGQRPIVHLPAGQYAVSTTLTIPAGSDVQLVGDGYGGLPGTELDWTGAGSGPVLSIDGPSKATLRDFTIYGNATGNGIVADGLDQQGARVFMHQTDVRYGTSVSLLVDGLDYTHVDLRNMGSNYMTSGVGVKVVGGTQAAAGNPLGGKTNLFSGLQTKQPMNYDVTNGGRLLVRDVWYEAEFPSGPPTFVSLGATLGTFTIDGSRISIPSNQASPAIAINGFMGSATFLTTRLDDRIVMSGNGSQMKVLGLGMVGTDFSANPIPDFFNNTTSPGATVGLVNSRQLVDDVPGTGSVQVADEGSTTTTFITDMLAHTRGERPMPISPLAAGITDLRFYRVWVTNTPVGIRLAP